MKLRVALLGLAALCLWASPVDGEHDDYYAGFALAVAVVHDDEPLPEGLDDEDDDVACSDLTAGFGDLAMGCFALNFGGDGEDDDAGGDGGERRSFILS